MSSESNERLDVIFSAVEFTGPKAFFVNFYRRTWEAYSDAIKKFRDGKKATANEWKNLASYASHEKILLVMSLLSLFAAALCEVAFPHYSSKALNAIAFSKDYTAFQQHVKGMLLFGILAPFFTGCRGIFFWVAGIRVITRLRLLLFSALLEKDIAFFDEAETGVLSSRLSSDTKKLENVVSFHFNILIREATQALGGLFYLFQLNWRLAMLACGAMTLVSCATSLYSIISRRLSRKVQDSLGKANSAAEQALSLIRVVRAHASEDIERRRYGSNLQRAMSMEESQGMAYGLARFILGGSRQLVSILVLLQGASFVMQGRITGEELTTFLFYTNFVSAASFDVGDQWAKIQEALGGGSAVFELLEGADKKVTEKPFLSDELAALDNSQVEDSSDIFGSRLVFDDVHFQYPSREAGVLSGVSFEVEPGQKCAIVGPSGGGKSTILRLLGQFYAADSGNVTIDGQDIQTIDNKDLSQRISWVTQEPELFSMSIAENIAYGLETGTYTQLDIEEAARGANIHNFITSLPEGYNTVVGEGGGSLSGGQKQRVAIARALVRDPQVLLLDEPTSALDTESEEIVQQALDKASQGRTVVLVAHRIATVKNADKIIVVQGGKIVETGTHTQLLSKQGQYASLVSRQRVDLESVE
eukprot:CAMPEP_0117760896 /NCGR_PEP_ID=MMETSP0947-20121206/16919_1 /TAXON_ID=44440 /ORGANISM="Chattonella subsalsa, Strain CCMP2191" /LENGTH=645 /DNA_ID=CAMNT_0005581707 /DNA_START=246 /DNA_END=2183 /DNA_ORIENTATION=+